MGAAPRIDLHTHILPEELPDLRRRFGYGDFVHLERLDENRARMMVGKTCFREIGRNCWDPAIRLAECDAAGVTVQVLSTIPILFSYWAKPQHAEILCSFLNDHLALIVSAHPGRFAGLGTVPLQDPDRAIREMERCLGELGLQGIEIGTHVNDWNLDQPELFPFFERAQELGAAIFVHPWDMMGRDRMPRYWLPWLVGMPAECSLAICSLIFGGVLERLPRLRIAFAHGGGSFPGTFGRIERGFAVRPDLCAVDNPVPPRAYLGKFYVDSLVHDPDALRLLLKLMGPERVALGTDYPFPLGEPEPGRTIESLSELGPEARDRLFRGTALEFLGVPGERFFS